MGGSFTVRGVEIGGEHTRICVPIMPATLDELEEIVCRLDTDALDIVEWRADALQNATIDDYLSGIEILRQKLPKEVPVLFTLRTSNEGGGFSDAEDVYAAALRKMAEAGIVDILDVELSTRKENACVVIEAATNAGVRVVVSHHNFRGIHSREQIISIYEQMFELGADIAKVALMPVSLQECLEIMSVAEYVQREYPERAKILIGMGMYGLASRIMAQEIGSCIAFAYDALVGVSAKTVALGQISAQDMRQILKITGGYEKN